MPIEDGVGYGASTPRKLEGFRKIVEMHLAITSAVLQKHGLPRRYRYIDLTAGKGYVPEHNLPGCALTFLDVVESKHGDSLSYRADFVELDSVNLNDLQRAVKAHSTDAKWKGSDLHFHLGRYQDLTTILLNEGRHSEFGLVFVDPSGDAPDVEAMTRIAAARQKMEILIYISATNLKRAFQYNGTRLSDYTNRLGKKHWMIRKPLVGDSQGWTFLLGSNITFKDYKKIDFLSLDGEEAQETFERLNLTQKERRASRQRGLFD